MMNGCICCTVREDLIVTIKKLIETKSNNFDHIIIETTGLATRTGGSDLFIDPELSKLCRLDSIITFIDAKFTGQHLDEQKPEGVENEAHEQVAFADVLVVNKTDLVSSEELEQIKKKIKNIMFMRLLSNLNIVKFQLNKLLILKLLIDQNITNGWGFLDIESEHQHDSSIKSFGIHIEGEFMIDKLNAWLSKLMKEKGTDLYRSKGILAIKESDDKFVFQAVHMIMNLASSSELGMEHQPWGEHEKRINKFCFIGKNLDKDQMISDLKECIFDGKPPEPGPVPTRKLKYKVGDRVKCKMNQWEQGTIVQLWYREELWESGFVALSSIFR